MPASRSAEGGGGQINAAVITWTGLADVAQVASKRRSTTASPATEINAAA